MKITYFITDGAEEPITEDIEVALKNILKIKNEYYAKHGLKTPNVNKEEEL